MYAIVEKGGYQYRVSVKDKLLIPAMNLREGDTIAFDRVLLVADGENVIVGTPYVKGYTVRAKIVGEKRGKRVIVFKFKRRKNYRRKKGHRQKFTEVEVVEIAKEV